MLKRLLDVIGAAVGIVLLSPVMGWAAYRIKREDGGPILYGGIRVGRGGKLFTMHKFRTMVPNAERLGGSSTAANDARLTKIGGVLRRHKIDELPQLFNVWAGEMSLVGPRPQVEWDVARYTEAERAILSVKPGLTDWASVAYANEGEILAASGLDADTAYDQLIRPGKIELELKYVQNQSLLGDLRILLQTLRALVPVGGHGAMPGHPMSNTADQGKG